jgi:hypothetical protein
MDPGNKCRDDSGKFAEFGAESPRLEFPMNPAYTAGMDMSPSEVRTYVERLLDEGRIASGLVEVANMLRPRFTEPHEASDSKGPTGSAEHYLDIWSMRFESAKRSGAIHRGFQETLDSLKSELNPKAPLRLLTLNGEGPLFAFLVEVTTERLVGLVFVETNSELTGDYLLFVQRELSEAATCSDPERIDFAYLRHWARWPDDKLRALYCDVVHDWMQRIQQALGSEDERALEVNADSFPGLVRACRQRMQHGTKELSEAIIRSSELAETGEPDEGRAVLQAFVDRCPSAFYRDIAVAHSQSL